jgi:hypothetical protein
VTDKDRYLKLNFIIANVVQQITELPPPSHGRCSCDERGHCAHHSTVFTHLVEAKQALERAQVQLQYPNGSGDKAQF